MPTPPTVDEYVEGFPPEVAERLRLVRAEIVGAIAAESGEAPEEKVV